MLIFSRGPSRRPLIDLAARLSTHGVLSCRSRAQLNQNNSFHTLRSHPSLPLFRNDFSSLRYSSAAAAKLAEAEVPTVEEAAPGLLVERLTPGAITLRPYQEDAIQACLDGLSEGVTRMGVSSPTGSGKTTMFMKLIPQVVKRETGRRGRAFILVNGVDLVNQAENAARRILGDGWSVDVEQASRVASGHADVTIATFQTLLSEDRLRKFDPACCDLVIVDEAHHAAAKSYLRILHYFNDGVKLPKSVLPVDGLNHGQRVPIIGFSATFSRQDQLSLAVVFEKIVFHRDVSHMLRDGWLSPAKCTTVKADLKLSTVEISSTTGDFVSNSLSAHVNTTEINELIVRTYLHLAEERRSTLVFCVSLEHVANVVATFRDAGIDARAISSLSKPAYRKRTLEDFMQGEFPVLVNCEVLTEGTDIPVIDCILLARPTKSRNLLAQMIGRGLRLSPATGKADCHIIDIADSTSQGLLVTPTLLGLTHDDIEEQEVRESTQKRALDPIQTNAVSEDSEPKDGKEDYKVTFIDQEDPFGLGGDGSRIKPVHKMSYNAWVACGKGKYILELMNGSHVKIEPSKSDEDEGRFVVTYSWKAPMIFGSALSKVYNHTRHVAYAHELERAFQTADAFALSKVGRERSLQLSRRAVWRQRPASPKAVHLLLKMKGVATQQAADELSGRTPIVAIMGKEVDVKGLTAGEVASYVSAAKHGAATMKMGQDEKAAARIIKLEKKKAKGRKTTDDLPFPASI